VTRAAFVAHATLAALGRRIGTLAYWLGYRRAHVEQALVRAGIAMPALSFYRSLGRSLVELLLVRPKVRFSAKAQEVLAAPTPVVFAVAHSGNWEWMAYACARQVPLAVLAKPLSIPLFNRAIGRIRARHNVHIANSLDALLRCLRDGMSVAVLTDQVPRLARHGQREIFLGAPALVDRTAALVAARAQRPLVFATSRRDGDEQVVDVPLVLAPPLDVGAATAAVNAALDAFVRQHPSEWLWSHRRWRLAESPCGVEGTVPVREQSGSLAESSLQLHP
jgi:lauroyl/myristoyl acyltransferase